MTQGIPSRMDLIGWLKMMQSDINSPKADKMVSCNIVYLIFLIVSSSIINPIKNQRICKKKQFSISCDRPLSDELLVMFGVAEFMSISRQVITEEGLQSIKMSLCSWILKLNTLWIPILKMRHINHIFVECSIVPCIFYYRQAVMYGLS